MRLESREPVPAAVAGRFLATCVLAAATLTTTWAAEQAKPDANPPPKRAAKKAAPTKAPTADLERLLAEQRALIDEQQKLIAEQTARIEELKTRSEGQDATIDKQQGELAALEQQLLALTQRLDELQGKVPDQAILEERLKKLQEAAEKEPEIPPDVVSAGDFPGSIRIPGTDAAIKFGGRIRMAAVFTLESLGSEDRFLTNSIPVDDSDQAAGKGARTSFSANTSRFNFEMRTPTGGGQMRAFIEGDFFGSNGAEARTAFRLRHAYAQFRGFIVGQTWSTFSDPAANHQDLDFEGINGENLIRQALIRYTWTVREDLSVAVAAETPEVSLTGGEGVNLVPDLVGRTIWTFKEDGHLQAAVVFRQIRGESDLQPDETQSAEAWGASLSGVVPFRVLRLTDRFLFQLNLGEGNARYINDLSSLGGEDAVFDPATGELRSLPGGFYLVYEHQWKAWERTRSMNLRSSIIWSFVTVDNLDFQTDESYHKTNRLSANLVFSPIPRIDVGIEYIAGTRENKDGNRGNSSQFQAVGIFRF